MFAWRFDTFLLGDEFFERCAWGCGFQGLVCLGTSISAPLLLGDFLEVDLLGSVRQGCDMDPSNGGTCLGGKAFWASVIIKYTLQHDVFAGVSPNLTVSSSH